MTIIWDILKWNRGQTKWDGGSIIFQITSSTYKLDSFKKNTYKLYSQNKNTGFFFA